MNSQEAGIFQTYSMLLAEIETLIATKKIRNDSIDSADGASTLKNSSDAAKAKEELEAALNDENLCPICFNRDKDTTYQPCQHESCKVCIQTHMLNK